MNKFQPHKRNSWVIAFEKLYKIKSFFKWFWWWTVTWHKMEFFPGFSFFNFRFSLAKKINKPFRIKIIFFKKKNQFKNSLCTVEIIKLCKWEAIFCSDELNESLLFRSCSRLSFSHIQSFFCKNLFSKGRKNGCEEHTRELSIELQQ